MNMQRETHILHRQIQADLPVADHGEGVYVIDTKGKRYLDACGGAAVSVFVNKDVAFIDYATLASEGLSAHNSFGGFSQTSL
ncbi:MAG: hypothetical protein HQ497_06970, partial [SAR86 cluster bacterium]|nr:hypothetical protein [SAR86 cluster bacterium]